jgi:hypothetical protein
MLHNIKLLNQRVFASKLKTQTYIHILLPTMPYETHNIPKNTPTKDTLTWVFENHKMSPFCYVYICSRLNNAYELFSEIGVAPVQIVDSHSIHTSAEINQMCAFYGKRKRGLLIY